jgi:hypothetical protein
MWSYCRLWPFHALSYAFFWTFQVLKSALRFAFSFDSQWSGSRAKKLPKLCASQESAQFALHDGDAQCPALRRVVWMPN